MTTHRIRRDLDDGRAVEVTWDTHGVRPHDPRYPVAPFARVSAITVHLPETAQHAPCRAYRRNLNLDALIESTRLEALEVLG